MLESKSPEIMVDEDLERDEDQEYMSDAVSIIIFNNFQIELSENQLIDSIRDEEYNKIKKQRQEDRLESYLSQR